MVIVCISQEKLQNEIQFSARRVVANHFDFTNPTVNERGLKEKLHFFIVGKRCKIRAANGVLLNIYHKIPNMTRYRLQKHVFTK